MSNSATPVLQKERIDIIDSLRGVAILGILLMNIPGFAFSVAGHDPSIRNEFNTINYYIWKLVSWIPDGTQRALFSMLFGAGIILFITGKEKQQSDISAADYFFRRQLWLIVFGLINIYILLWHGDILFDYGCYGMLMFVFRLWEPKKLIIAASVCILLMVARENRDLYLDKQVIAKGEAIEKIDTTVTKLTQIQQDDLAAMQEIRDKSKKESKIKRDEKRNKQMRGSYGEVYESVTNTYLGHLLAYTYFSIWDVISFMLLGMAFLKMGILTGKSSVKLYAVMCVVGLGLGLLISYYQLQKGIDAGFSQFEHIKRTTFSFYDIGRVLRTLGILGFLMLLYKSNWFKWFFSLLRPVGQMAFTNYLTQSLICAIIFTGIGFGYFGKLQRYEAYTVVLSIWLLQIVWSHIWLHYFQYGPFEWVWRQLTYWKKLPLKKMKPVV